MNVLVSARAAERLHRLQPPELLEVRDILDRLSRGDLRGAYPLRDIREHRAYLIPAGGWADVAVVARDDGFIVTDILER
jgi:hypothetical protein